MNLEPGDRVRLNGSGPVLIAQDVYSNASVACTWMDEMGQRHEGAFPLDCLQKLDPFDFECFARNVHTDNRASERMRHGVKRTHLQTLAMTFIAAVGVYLVR